MQEKKKETKPKNLQKRFDALKSKLEKTKEELDIQRWGAEKTRVGAIALVKELLLKGKHLNKAYENIEKKVEERTAELQESGEKFQGLFEHAADAIFIVDLKKGILLDANKAAEKLTGRTRKELIGMHQSKLHPASEVKKYVATFKKHMKKGKKIQFEAKALRKDGSRVPIIISAAVMNWKKEPIIIALFKDITEIKKIDELKAQFLIMTSHELRTPMTPILAQAQMLSDQSLGKLSGKQKKSTEIILRNMLRLNNLIEDILDISRIQSAQLNLALKKSQLAECIKETIEEMKPLVAHKNITLDTKIQALPKTAFDQRRMRQVLTNLIENAISFTPEKGKITIEATKQKDAIVVKVTDTGIGISAKNLKELFKPFFQVTPAYIRKEKGTGLGLSICKGIIEQQGGKIWAKSTLGKGSTFSFTIPLQFPKKNKKPRKTTTI